MGLVCGSVRGARRVSAIQRRTVSSDGHRIATVDAPNHAWVWEKRMVRPVFKADHWRRQAEQARATALNFETEESRQAIRRVAESYDRMAEIVDKRAVPHQD